MEKEYHNRDDKSADRVEKMIVIDLAEGWEKESPGNVELVTPGVWSSDGGYPTLTRPEPGAGNPMGKVQITTLHELYLMTTSPYSHYILMNDIDASETETWNDGLGWMPVGTGLENFVGSFDGNGYTISNLHINRPDEAHIGLFGITGSSAIIKNVVLEDVHILGLDYTAGIVGDNSGKILDCHVTGTISGGHCTGGIAGENNLEVRRSSFVGAITGRAEPNVGGLVGDNISEDSLIEDSYFQGSISNPPVPGPGNCGGITNNNNGNIIRCYAVPLIVSSEPLGGVVAINTGTVTASYWDTEYSGISISADGEGKTTTQMYDISTYDGWDFGEFTEFGITYDDGVVANLGSMSPMDAARIFTTGEWNLSETPYASIKLTMLAPPSKFNFVKLYIRDYMGKDATYNLKNKDIGKWLRIPIEIFKQASGFNLSTITEVGIVFGSPKIELSGVGISIRELSFGAIVPRYTTAQRVIDQLGIMDPETNTYLQIGHDTQPNLHMVEQWIMEAESYIDTRCRDSWKENRATNIMLNRPEPWAGKRAGGRNPFLIHGNAGQIFGKGHIFRLPHRKIRDFDPAKGDKIEMREIGQNFKDISDDSSYFWFDYKGGRLHIRKWFVSSASASLRVSYRWGDEYPPEDIQRATTLKAAANIIQTDWYRLRLPGGPGFDPPKGQTVNEWLQEVEHIVAGRQTIVMTGGV